MLNIHIFKVLLLMLINMYIYNLHFSLGVVVSAMN